MRVIITLFFTASLFFIWITTVNAHNRSESYSNWSLQDKTLTVVVVISAREATRIPPTYNTDQELAVQFAAYLSQRITVLSNNVSCLQTSAIPLAAKPGFLRIELGFDCDDMKPERIHYLGLFDVVPSHVHFARLSYNGIIHGEFLFSAERSEWQIPTATTDQDIQGTNAGQHNFWGFLKLGIAHIVTGYDHIAFLLGVMLVAGRFRQLLIAITGFTLGHSLTLSIAVLGFVEPEARLVEAFIGLTIVVVAVEYVAARAQGRLQLALLTALVTVILGLVAWLTGVINDRAALAYLGMGLFTGSYLALDVRALPVSIKHDGLIGLITMLFGLVHGFGFADFLIGTGLSSGNLIRPLLGFNLGVEVGQIALVISMGAVVYGLRKWVACLPKGLSTHLPTLLISCLCGLGIFWFVERTFS